jgi:hypothetical protein
MSMITSERRWPAAMVHPRPPYAGSVPSVHTAARQVLAELSLVSVVPARAVLAATSTNPPESAPPARGDRSPVDHWRARFDATTDDAELAPLVLLAREELAHLRRRSLPVSSWSTLDDLNERVAEGVGLSAEALALALRCTPRLVARLRVAAGCDAAHGRPVALDRLDPRALLAAGMSYRAVAAATGIPRSTLHDRITTNNQ